MKLYIGIDGGGTKTRVIVMDLDALQGVAVSGGASNPNSVGWTTALERIRELVANGLAECGAHPRHLHSLCAALAGVSSQEARLRMERELGALFPHARMQVVPDALAALSAGTEARPGVALIAGTGTIAISEDHFGVIRRAGGFGYLVGDEGSGFEIGRRGVRAALQSFEQRGPTTVLSDRLCQFYEVAHPADAVTAIYRCEHPVARIAAFAPAVIQNAERDSVAQGIVTAALDAHAALLESVIGQSSESAFAVPIVLGGGLYAHNSHWLKELQLRLPNRAFRLLVHSPAAGAALRAVRQTVDGPLPQKLVQAWSTIAQKLDPPDH
ncbi:MAG: N-acetylglucosamine kinase [Bacilli bacterium]